MAVAPYDATRPAAAEGPADSSVPKQQRVGARLLINDPSKIDEPEIVEHAKKEMLRFNAAKHSSHSNSAQCPGQSVAELFASFGSMRDRDVSAALAPMVSQLQSSNPSIPNWSIPADDSRQALGSILRLSRHHTVPPASRERLGR